jgi:hypothetical protein
LRVNGRGEGEKESRGEIGRCDIDELIKGKQSAFIFFPPSNIPCT